MSTRLKSPTHYSMREAVELVFLNQINTFIYELFFPNFFVLSLSLVFILQVAKFSCLTSVFLIDDNVGLLSPFHFNLRLG